MSINLKTAANLSRRRLIDRQIAIEVFALLVESGTSAFTAVELFNCAVTFRGALDPVISSSNLNVMRT